MGFHAATDRLNERFGGGEVGSDRVGRAGVGGDREGRGRGGVGGSHRSMGGHRNEKVPVAGPVVSREEKKPSLLELPK